MNAEKVYSFDIQDEAIKSTASLLEENNIENVVLIKDSHENVKEYVKEAPSVIVFNFGFLPGGDKALTTKKESSLKALETSLEILAVNGVLCATMYPGHEEGKKEQELILAWAKTLSSREYHVVFANMLNQSDRAPQVLWITKKR